MSYRLRAAAMAAVSEEIVAAAGRFADEHVLPHAADWDRGIGDPEPVLRKAIGLFTGTAIPAELGGKACNFATLTRVYEEIARRDMGFTCALAVHTNVAVAVSKSGNAALVRRLLPGLIDGSRIGALLLTEPDVGSDATAITAAATRVAGGYRVAGAKAWVTNGRYADLLITFFQTEPGTGAKGIVALAVDRRAHGVIIESPLDLMGSAAMGTTDAVFREVEIRDDEIAFPAGQAFKAAMFGITVARLGVAAMCNGALTGGLDHATAYASQREAFGQPLIAHQGLSWILAETATDLEASRSLTFQAAQSLDTGTDAGILISHAKKYATRVSFSGLSQCMRALGANGLKRDHNLSRQLAAARISECMDGTGEIHNIIIARQLSN